MKLIVTLAAEDEKAGKVKFEVDLPRKQFNILKESAKLIASITESIKAIQHEIKEK